MATVALHQIPRSRNLKHVCRHAVDYALIRSAHRQRPTRTKALCSNTAREYSWHSQAPLRASLHVVAAYFVLKYVMLMGKLQRLAEQHGVAPPKGAVCSRLQALLPLWPLLPYQATQTRSCYALTLVDLRVCVQGGLLGRLDQGVALAPCPLFVLPPLQADIDTATAALRARLSGAELAQLAARRGPIDRGEHARRGVLSGTSAAQAQQRSAAELQQPTTAQDERACRPPAADVPTAASTRDPGRRHVRPAKEICGEAAQITGGEPDAQADETPFTRAVQSTACALPKSGAEAGPAEPVSTPGDAEELWAEAFATALQPLSSASQPDAPDPVMKAGGRSSGPDHSTGAQANAQGNSGSAGTVSAGSLGQGADRPLGQLEQSSGATAGAGLPTARTAVEAAVLSTRPATAASPEGATERGAVDTGGAQVPAGDAPPLDLMAWYMGDGAAVAEGDDTPAWAAAAVPAEQLLQQQQQQQGADAAASASGAAAAAAGSARGGRGGRGRGRGRGRGAGRGGRGPGAGAPPSGGVEKGGRGKRRAGRLVKELAATEAAVASGAVEVGYFAHIKQFEVAQRRRGAGGAGVTGQPARQAAAYSLRNGQTSDPRNK